jgi:hypothetical protein
VTNLVLIIIIFLKMNLHEGQFRIILFADVRNVEEYIPASANDHFQGRCIKHVCSLRL